MHQEVELHPNLWDLHRSLDDLETGFGEHTLSNIGRLLSFGGGPGLEELLAVGIVVGDLEEGVLTNDLDGSQTGPGSLCFNPRLGNLAVFGIEIEPEPTTTGALSGNERGTRTQERVEHTIAFIGVEIDQATRKLYREGGRMLHASCGLRADLPDIERGFHKVIGRHSAFAALGLDSIEPPFAGDDHALGEVSQHRIRGATVRPPGDRTSGAFGLLPNDLAAQQETQVVLQDRDHIGAQAPIGLAPEISDIDGDAAAWFEHLNTGGEDIAQHLEIVEVRSGNTRHRTAGVGIARDRQFVFFAHEIGRRCGDEGNGIGRQNVGDRSAVAIVDGSETFGHRIDGVVGADLGRREAIVERRRIVALPLSHAKGSGCSGFALL